MFRTEDSNPSIKPKVLLVNLEGTEEGQTAGKLLEAMNIEAIFVGSEALDMTVTEAFGTLELPPEDPDKAIREEEPDGSSVAGDTKLLVMGAMTRQELEKFLEDYRQTEAPPVRLKAVATHNNKDWKLRNLAFELNREQQTMSLYSVLVRSIQAVEMMNAKDYTRETWDILEAQAVKAAEYVTMLRSQKEVPIPALQESWNGLQDAVNGLIPSLEDEETFE